MAKAFGDVDARPDPVEVSQGDLVRITLVTEDIPHSFAVDA
jgi:hypothetical protein